MTTAEVLQKARDLIADESRWTHGQYARDAEGYSVYPNEPSATCWCALGAVYHVLDTTEEDVEDRPAPIRALYLDNRPVPVDVNDRDGHEAVLALFDEAIAKAAA